MRVGEITGLRWCDIDLEEEVINVNHTLVYYCTRTEAGQILQSIPLRQKQVREQFRCFQS